MLKVGNASRTAEEASTDARHTDILHQEILKDRLGSTTVGWSIKKLPFDRFPSQRPVTNPLQSLLGLSLNGRFAPVAACCAAQIEKATLEAASLFVLRPLRSYPDRTLNDRFGRRRASMQSTG